MSDSGTSSTGEAKMGLIACICYVVGNVIGSGIFITPTGVLKLTNSIGSSLVVWLISGLISILGGIAYIELGTGIPSDGGDFAYATYIGWDGLAFAFMWVSALLTYPASTAVQATTFGQYIVTGFLPFINIEESSRVFYEYAVGFTLLVSCSIMNLYAIDKIASKFQIAVTFLKGALLLIVCGIGAYYVFFGPVNNLAHPFEGTSLTVGSTVMAVYGGLWSYAGWDILNYGAPSVNNPRRTLPLALMVGLVSVTVIYVLTNAAYCAVLSTEGMLNSTAIAADFAQHSMGRLSIIVPFCTAILLMGTLNANIFCTSRIIYEAARQGHLPPFLSAIHKKNKSPRAAIILQMICSIAVSFKDVETLINYVTFVMWAQKLVTMLAMIVMKLNKKEMDPGVIRVPIIISFLFLIVSAILVFIPFYTDPWITILGCVFVGSGLIFYVIFVKPKQMPSFINNINDTLNKATSKLLNCDIPKNEEPEKTVHEKDILLPRASESV